MNQAEADRYWLAQGEAMMAIPRPSWERPATPPHTSRAPRLFLAVLFVTGCAILAALAFLLVHLLAKPYAALEAL